MTHHEELNVAKPVKGLGWGAGAISNAVWGGVSLREVLQAYGVDDTKINFQRILRVVVDVLWYLIVCRCTV